MNQDDYRKLAIARSVERARKEAEEKKSLELFAVKNTDTKQNLEKKKTLNKNAQTKQVKPKTVKQPTQMQKKQTKSTAPQKQVRGFSVMPKSLSEKVIVSRDNIKQSANKQSKPLNSQPENVKTAPQPAKPKYREISSFAATPGAGMEYTAAVKSSTMINSSRLKTARLNKQNNSEQGKMKVIFLGGVGEIGKNMTAVEYDNEILVIDSGMSFPTLDMPGIDSVIPDFTYLKENKDKVKALLITHGHEDHIGAVPFFLKEVNVPIFAGKLTLALLENKLKEHGVNDVKMNVAVSRRVARIGKFEVEFVDVNHSIPDAYAIRITTPAGTLFHTGDFKIDFAPIDGRMIDLSRIAEIGNNGVDLLLCESTNVEYEGYTLSESTVGEKLDAIFDENRTRRMFVATFSSNIYRVQQVLSLAEKYGRKVALIGRSMLKNLEAAIKVEKLNFPKSLFVDIEKVNKYEDNEILILCTGSQGESNAALSRLANGDYSKVEIGSNDIVIFSSSPIPGNESNINKVINNLYKKGAIVIHENVHASGHACIEELKTMHSLIKPKFFTPVHGEYRHLKKHAILAENTMHMPKNNILIADIGDTIVFDRNSFKLGAKVQAGETLVDGFGFGDVSSSVLKERKLLAEEGLVAVVIGIYKETNTFVTSPIVITRGCVYDDEEEEIEAETKKIIIDELTKVMSTKKIDWEEAKQIIRKPIRNLFLKRTKRQPIILPVIFFI